MTLHELLHCVTFDEVLQHLGCITANQCEADYKVHYDILRHITPQLEEGDTQVTTISNSEPDEHTTDTPRLDAYPLEGELWEIAVAREIELASGVEATLPEIAACCLWHTSFYGFTEAQRADTYSQWLCDDNVSRFSQIDSQYLPSKKEMLRIRSFHNALHSKMKLHRHRCSKDRAIEIGILGSKRKWRSWKRYFINDLYNKRISMISAFIADLLNRGENLIPPPTMQELCPLFKVEHCHICSYQSYAHNASERYNYLRELIERYHAFKSHDLPNSLICLSASESHPITMEEMGLIQLIAGQCDGDNVFCIKTDNSLGEELRADAMFYIF